MWDYKSPIHAALQKAMSQHFDNLGLEVDQDEMYGLYTVTETAGYAPPAPGPDFFFTLDLSLGFLCWLVWAPPKSDAMRSFIEDRRSELFRGAREDVGVRLRIAARVNRFAFAEFKRQRAAGIHAEFSPFDFFDFS